MATVNYYFRSKNNPSKIYCKFSTGRQLQIAAPLEIVLNPEFWDQKNQKVRNIIKVRDRDEINRKLALLKMHILDAFNLDFMNGSLIDSQWLKETINIFFNRPKNEEKVKASNHNIYYTSFIDWWMQEKAPYWLTGIGKYMTAREQSKYNAFATMVKDFEGKKKISFKTLSNATISDFVANLSENNYSPVTIKRHVGRFKFFCLRAEEEGIVFNKSYRQRVFIPEVEEVVKEPYFNPEEIEKIFKHNFSASERLDNARDNLIIALWTGLRVSDFLSNLNIDNFIDDFIEIKTQKTKTPVVIPLHPMLKRLLIKRNGKLPKKISDQGFNKDVKEVCKLVGINELIKGRLYDKVKKRKVTGMYKKYQLVSSHIGRRSFSTNLVGKIDDNVIMAVCGWSNKDMMYHYVKTTNREHAIKLQEYWEKTY